MSNRVSPVIVGFLVGCSLVCALVWLMSAHVLAQAPASSSSQQKTNTANAEQAAVFERILNRAHFENDATEVTETWAVVRIQSQADVHGSCRLAFADSTPPHNFNLQSIPEPNPTSTVLL